jgi:hypothetical protein
MYTQEQIDGTEKIIRQGNCSGIQCSRCLGMAKDRCCYINTSDTHLWLAAQIGPKGIKDLTERLAKAKQEMGAFKIGDRGSPAFKVGDRVKWLGYGKGETDRHGIPEDEIGVVDNIMASTLMVRFPSFADGKSNFLEHCGHFVLADMPAFKVGDRVQRKTGGPTRIRSIFDPNSGRTFEVEMSMPITPKLVYQELYENTKPSTRKAIRCKLLGL